MEKWVRLLHSYYSYPFYKALYKKKKKKKIKQRKPCKSFLKSLEHWKALSSAPIGPTGIL